MKFKTANEITEFLLPIAEREGVEIVDVEVKLSKNPSLTVFIETEDGVDLDTLERFHNAIDAPLDEFDPSFSQPYTLNVSSPGLDRAFKTDRDYERNLGLDVEVRLFAMRVFSSFISPSEVFSVSVFPSYPISVPSKYLLPFIGAKSLTSTSSPKFRS